MQKIKELRQIIREKDFEIEDTKRVCIDVVQQKEQAYQALLEDMNKIRPYLLHSITSANRMTPFWKMKISIL